MRLGKLDNEQLQRLILDKFTHSRKEVLASPGIGVDCAAVDLGGRIAVLSTDPITAAAKDLGRLTVHVSCNDAAAAGAEPIGLLVTLLVPPSAQEKDIETLAEDLAEAAKEANVDIIGGHTEVSDCVNRMITCATVLAKSGEKGLIMPNGMRPGNDLVLTKYAGLEGTAVIAGDFSHRLDFLSEAELEQARELLSKVSVVKEGLYAAAHGATAMHDVTEGGVLGAVWEMSDASGCGIIVERESIPVLPVTEKICRKLALDPLKLLSSGAMLIACENGKELCAGLAELGIPACVIGRAEGENARFSDGTKILPPKADELHRLFP